MTIDELDIVGDPGQSLAPLPAGVRKISGRIVDGYLVYRFKLPEPWRTDPAQINARALQLAARAGHEPSVR